MKIPYLKIYILSLVSILCIVCFSLSTKIIVEEGISYDAHKKNNILINVIPEYDQCFINKVDNLYTQCGCIDTYFFYYSVEMKIVECKFIYYEVTTRSYLPRTPENTCFIKGLDTLYSDCTTALNNTHCLQQLIYIVLEETVRNVTYPHPLLYSSTIYNSTCI